MTVSVLNGGVPGKITATTPMDEFVGEFIDRITPLEWRLLRHLPNIPDYIILINAVVQLRRDQVAKTVTILPFWRATP